MTAEGYARPDLLVETDWLEDHLYESNIRIVDCDQFDLYKRAHIKNAIGIPVHHYVKEREYIMDTRKYPLVAPPDLFSELVGSMGIGNDSLVIVYDNAGGLYATRFWWALNYYGHTNVKLLNGGWKKWCEEGRPITLDSPEFQSNTFSVCENPDLVCTLEYGMSQISNPDTLFLDVRSEGEWEGTNTRGNKRSGHIPGAIHLEWLNFITDDKHMTFKSANELRTILEKRGVTPNKQVITY